MAAVTAGGSPTPASHDSAQHLRGGSRKESSLSIFFGCMDSALHWETMNAAGRKGGASTR